MKKEKFSIKKRLVCMTVAAACFLTAAQADTLADSTIGVGIKNMLNDVGSFLLILCPIAGGVAAVYFLIRRGIADEQDGKMWMKRVVVAIGCSVAGMLVAGLIKQISGYFA